MPSGRARHARKVSEGPLGAWRRGMAVNQVVGARQWRLARRLECDMCALPSRIEIAAIERDQSACGFEDRIRLLRQCLTAGVRKSRRQPADRIELMDQHSGRRRGGLTDLIERELDEALEPNRRHPHRSEEHTSELQSPMYLV